MVIPFSDMDATRERILKGFGISLILGFALTVMSVFIARPVIDDELNAVDLGLPFAFYHQTNESLSFHRGSLGFMLPQETYSEFRFRPFAASLLVNASVLAVISLGFSTRKAR